MRFLVVFFIAILMIGCSQNQPLKSQTATILIKTPTMKFYDLGFILEYEDYTQIQIYSAGKTLLDLKLYENSVCKSTFECESSKEFNKKYLSSTYKENFLKELFDKKEKETIFRDKENKILIKIKRD